MTREQKVKEINEALIAGKRALNSLEQAEESLDSASNWGIWDMLGGSFFSGMMKHSKMGNAQEEMEEARKWLLQLQEELRDIQVPLEFRMEVSSFLSFADFFFDGLIADWMVQSKIKEAKEQIVTAKHKVTRILENLKQWESQLLMEGRGDEDGMSW